MAYPIILLVVIAIIAGFLLLGRGDLTAEQRRGTLIGLGVAIVAILGLLVYLITDDAGDDAASTTEGRLLAALGEQDPADMATLTLFAQSTLDGEVDAAQGFLFDSERRLVMCVMTPQGEIRGIYLRRNTPADDFDRDTRTEASLRTELERFCAAAF